ncbi:MAG TPA: two-component regulator propeller domain-containing protein [Bacteroidales bacterium]|nr:two-component regulator propeller domain-containing protein [Bacteroidales bacterium]HRX96631.1 two-component regulator propeller domain-containing protein [Bacteroidales bacterium]
MNFDIGPLKLIISIIFLSIAASSTLCAQFPVIKNYTVNDGLPSSKVYDIAQDSSGYLWIATESGISRFDGYDFKNYTKPDGLPSNSIVKLYVDYKNRLWFSTYQGEVGYIHDENVHVHWISQVDSLSSLSFYDHIFVDTNDHIYLSPYYNGLIKIDGDSMTSVGVQGRDTVSYIRNALYYQKKGNNYILGRLNLLKKYRDNISSLAPGVNLVEFTDDFHKEANYHKCIASLDDGSVLLSYGPVLIKLKDGNVIFKKKFQSDIIFIYQDTFGSLWVSEEFSGVKYYKSGDLNEPPISYLTENTLSALLQDYEGSYWFSSTENGLFYVPSAQFINYNSNTLNIDNDVIQAVSISYPDIFFSTGNKGIYKAKMNASDLSVDHNFHLKSNVISTISSILITHDHELWLSSTEHLRYDFGGNPIYPFDTDRRHSGYKLFELHDGKILLGFAIGFLTYNKDGIDRNFINKDFNHKTFTFCQSEDSTVWIGTIDGLFYMENHKIKPFMISSSVLSSRISDIVCTKNYLAVGTFDNGLVLINKTNKEIKYINELEGLASHRVKSLLTDKADNIWVGTNHGLSEISLSDKDSTDFEIRNFTIWDGLPSNEINDMSIEGDIIILGTDDGLVQFNTTEVKYSEYQPEAKFVAVKLNDSRNNFLESEPLFKYNQNNIEFSFRLKSFKDPQKAMYMYKLEGFENEWYLTKNTSIRYPKLHPGDYRFIVKAKSYAGEWSDTIEYSFTIKKHFTQYLAFKIAMIVAIISVIFLIVYIIVATFRNREELKRQAILAEQKAVRSQMNPHFIFNSLNSIQNFIVEKDDKNANLYLVIFSSLIRRILEASKHNFISLKEEIETIKLYLELEKFRFEKHFDYSIVLDTSINADQVSIPSMLLQPYLENAIWHGIVPKQSKGVLKVEFKLVEPGLMKISIIDDGIGRVRAAEINKRRKHHKPTGMKNVEERLGLLNKLNNTNMRVKIIDLYDDQNFAIGTRVDFLIEI